MFKKISSVGVLSVAMLVGCSADTEKKIDEDPVEEVTWSYDGETGPANWHTLHPEYAACDKGEKQSPINIDTSKVKLDDDLEPLDISYHSTSFSIENNGHTVKFMESTGENSIKLEGEKYTLQQFHFHIPSENTLNGNHFEMEGHLVHQNEAGDLAVLAFLIEEGETNPVLAEAFSNIPSKQTKEELSSKINLNALLPEDLSTFRYSGSLTTPPCSEEVNWIVLKKPIELSKQQIEAFSEQFPHGNARDPQPLNEREVYQD